MRYIVGRSVCDDTVELSRCGILDFKKTLFDRFIMAVPHKLSDNVDANINTITNLP